MVNLSHDSTSLNNAVVFSSVHQSSDKSVSYTLPKPMFITLCGYVFRVVYLFPILQADHRISYQYLITHLISSRSSEIGNCSYHITLKFYRRLDVMLLMHLSSVRAIEQV